MDQHIRGLKALGAKVAERYGFIEARAENLAGREICLDLPSVGATENLIMAATLASGVTILRNAAREPEIVDLTNFLNSMGARIKGAGTDVIRVDGVQELGGTEYSIIPDRIEASTFIIAAAVTGGDVLLHNVIPEHLDSVISKLREAGTTINQEGNSLRINGKLPLRAVDLKTMPFPGFPTDVQPQMMVMLSLAEGTSIITETVFENRFKHVDELRRMGADIRVEGRTAIVKGIKRLSGAYVETSDLRAGAALVTAGLIAEGATIVGNIHHMDRGYENFEQKLRALGGQIIRVNGSGINLNRE